jgi:hypothetical protein
MDQGIAQLLVIAFAAASVISFVEMRSALKAPMCPECSHCRSLAYERRRHEEDLRESYARRYGFLDREDDDGPRSGPR